MKLYYDKLIRLPIKFETLEFNEIVDEDIFKKYKTEFLSDKGSETIERSYEITKSFIYQIGNRVLSAAGIERQLKNSINNWK